MLASYVEQIVDRDSPEAGRDVRNPHCCDAATPGRADKPSRSATVHYRDTLERIWIYDPVLAWTPTRSRLTRLTGSPKHHLADPALAVALLDLDRDSLLDGADGAVATPREGPLLGSLFESLIALSVRVFAQSARGRVHHLRTRGGEREIDFVVSGRGGRVVAIQVKLAQTISDRDVRRLHWLKEQIGPDLVNAVVVTTGTEAYRREDGFAVVPASSLSP